MTNSSKTSDKSPNSTESRLIPFTVAGIICFGAALVLGMGSWYLFGTSHKWSPEKDTAAVQTGSQISNQTANQTGAQNTAGENLNAAVSNTAAPVNAAPAPPVEIRKAPAGEISISGGEVTLGGAPSKLPLRRVAVEPFAVGETEVTNGQYAEFVEETKHAAPTGWSNNRFPAGAADEPVAGVTWADANSYCEWLTKKIGAAVRLPTEAEWELAARGSSNFKYPWGKDWNKEAAASRETNSKIRPVKSFPQGRSPLGVYDLIGNVWEWTSDAFADELGKQNLFEGKAYRVIKGGSVKDVRSYLKIKTREGRPENKPSELIGFRYVVVRR